MPCAKSNGEGGSRAVWPRRPRDAAQFAAPCAAPGAPQVKAGPPGARRASRHAAAVSRNGSARRMERRVQWLRRRHGYARYTNRAMVCRAIASSLPEGDQIAVSWVE